MYELIISEKPAAAEKIALALADKNVKKESRNGVPYFILTRKGRKIVVGCAAGHLFALAEKVKSKSLSYPVFDIEWLPVFLVDKSARFTKAYYDALRALAKGAEIFTVATDYDVEGEVIGLNIIRYICNRNDARRMKFSTLTKPDLVAAYERVEPHLNWGDAEAGETRHFLDYYYGINISRALMSAIKSAGMFKILSTGRVQGPALKIVVDREREIAAFKPKPYWEIELVCSVGKSSIFSAWHIKDPFWEEAVAQEVMKKIKGAKEGVVVAVEKKDFEHKPPTPLDLTTLQTEAHRCFGISPKSTLDIAQELYIGGYISYPRTSSQKLPQSIGYERIIRELSKQKNYAAAASELLKSKKLSPCEGIKTDPAHPAIYPTGIAPKGLEPRHQKIYDLIVKRFLATFGKPAKRQTILLKLDVKGEQFVARGTRTVDEGWYPLYAPYIKLEETDLPAFNIGDSVKIKKTTLHAKQTAPPKRYNPSSLVRELERRGLGTKATRSEIVETLYKRNYIKGEQIRATELGMHAIEILERYCPKIIDEQMTRHFEQDMDSISRGIKKKEEVLEEARTFLVGLLEEFRSKERKIGEGLLEHFMETEAGLLNVGMCPVCKKGSLTIRKGKYGRFIACDRYPDCRTTFKLPPTGMVEVSKEVCGVCGYPMIKIIKKGKKPAELCINLDCPSKAAVGKFAEGHSCPSCKVGKLVIRKSIYGSFIACTNYPKCRYVQRGQK